MILLMMSRAKNKMGQKICFFSPQNSNSCRSVMNGVDPLLFLVKTAAVKDAVEAEARSTVIWPLFWILRKIFFFVGFKTVSPTRYDNFLMVCV